MKANRIWAMGAALCLSILLAPTSACAQSIWTSHVRQSSVAVEWLKPNMDGEDELTFFTSALFISGRAAVSDGLEIVGELPISHLGIDSEFFDISETAVGNPYLGLAWGSQGAPIVAELGVRIPLASSDNQGLFTGLIADLDRGEAFEPDMVWVVAYGNFWHQSSSGIGVRLRGGPLVGMNTGGGGFGDAAELLLSYSGQGSYDAGRVHVAAGLTGRMLVTESELSLAERSYHQVGIGIVSRFGRIHPGIHLRIPVDDDLRRVLDFVFGLNVTMLVK